MTNHIPNDLSHLSDAEFNSLCPQGEHAPGPEALSPAAQAVLDAAAKAQLGSCYTQFESIAAALRAVVHGIDYITSEEIHAIADELDDVKYGTYRSALSDKPK
jgi:hypothetical protein